MAKSLTQKVLNDLRKVKLDESFTRMHFNNFMLEKYKCDKDKLNEIFDKLKNVGVIEKAGEIGLAFTWRPNQKKVEEWTKP